MDPRQPDRFEELLTRAFDGELSPADREELSSLANLEPRLAALDALREALRAALAEPGPVDVAGEVMAILAEDQEWSLGDALRGAVTDAGPLPFDIAAAVMGGIAEDAAWAPHGAALREAVVVPVNIADAVLAHVTSAEAYDAAWAPFAAALRDAVSAPVDLADDVLAALDPDFELSAYVDGALSPERTAAVAARLLRDAAARDQVAAFASLGEGLRDATARGADLWPGVADGIGAERDAIHGWAAIAAPIREAFAALPEIDVAGAVMAAVEPARHRMPAWASLGGPILAFAAAAAVLFAVLPMSPNRPAGSALSGEVGGFRLAAVNDAQIEDVSAAQDVVVQVMQFEEGGPTFILVDEPSGSGVPL